MLYRNLVAIGGCCDMCRSYSVKSKSTGFIFCPLDFPPQCPVVLRRTSRPQPHLLRSSLCPGWPLPKTLWTATCWASGSSTGPTCLMEVHTNAFALHRGKTFIVPVSYIVSVANRNTVSTLTLAFHLSLYGCYSCQESTVLIKISRGGGCSTSDIVKSISQSRTSNMWRQKHIRHSGCCDLHHGPDSTHQKQQNSMNALHRFNQMEYIYIKKFKKYEYVIYYSPSRASMALVSDQQASSYFWPVGNYWRFPKKTV